MKLLVYLFSLPFIYGIAILPFWLLYLFSDFLYLLIYHLFGYRKKVVRENLKKSFPEKSETELKLIERKFYRYLCDLLLETLKTLTITPGQVRKRVALKDSSVVRKYFDQKQSIIVVMGHFGNWELAGARFGIEPLHQLCVLYKRMENPYYEKLFYRMRTRLGNRVYEMRSALRRIVQDRGQVTATAFISDQSAFRKSAYWTQFLNQDTAVFTGTEKVARKLDYPVIYVSVKRPRRGYYEVIPSLLCEKPSATEEFDISEWHTRQLEADIREQPEIWFWVHRRWKHQRQDIADR